MSIAKPANKSRAIRNLIGLGMTDAEIVENTGYSISLIRRVRSRQPTPSNGVVIEARGPLSAHQVAARLRISYAAARLVTDR